MNPLVEQMLNATVSNDVETRLLEDLFEQEAKCEGAHNYTPYCSGDVTYRITSCVVDVMSCKSNVDNPGTGVRVRMNRPGLRCIDCGNPASECWTIRPI